jgi:hypothetical protein
VVDPVVITVVVAMAAVATVEGEKVVVAAMMELARRVGAAATTRYSKLGHWARECCSKRACSSSSGDRVSGEDVGHAGSVDLWGSRTTGEETKFGGARKTGSRDTLSQRKEELSGATTQKSSAGVKR